MQKAQYIWCWEISDLFHARVQVARDIQLQRFSNNESAEIVGNANMGIGEIWKFRELQKKG